MASENPTRPEEVAAALAESLAAHPEAGVGAMSNDGLFQPMPATVPLGPGHQPVAGLSPFDLVSEASLGAIIEGWRRAQAQGIGIAPVQTPDGEPATILCFDVTATHGTFVMILIAGEAVTVPAVDEQAALPSRFGAFRREKMAGIIAVDEGAQALLGWELADLAGRPTLELIHPDDQPNTADNWMDMLLRPGVPQRYRARHRHKDGRWIWVEITNTNRLADPEHGDVLSAMMDISEEMATAEALREREELLRRLTEALPLGVVQIDQHGTIVHANRQLFEIVGCERAETLDEQIAAVLADDRPRLFGVIADVLATGEQASVEVRLRLAGAAEDRFCHVALRALLDVQEQVTGAVLCIADITESVVMRQELEVRATFDLLTRCYNRASAMTALERLVAHATPESGVGVIFVDVDRFKPVNDELGHASGDALLIHIADRLRGVVRNDDFVGRLGGDEFLVVCPGIGHRRTVADIARRIGADVVAPVFLAGRPVSVTASVGVACSMDGYRTADALVAAADAAMYAAKGANRRGLRSGDGTQAQVVGFPTLAPASPPNAN
jgi:diguanylate cyclase (GGDEF)-like protein/PAS domain S-box-containing protein